MILNLSHIKSARQRISKYIHRTPVMTCRALNKISGSELFFKCENFQKTGAFKFRGACNAVLKLGAQESNFGVITHSSGNHGAALALAASIKKIKAYVIMPENSAQIKKSAVLNYGGKITYCEPTLKAREKTLVNMAAQTKAAVIHPYNNYDIMAGQGTAALEFMEDENDLDVIITPVGGGGLLAGTSITAKALNPGILIFGAEPKGADDARLSFKAGRIIPQRSPKTIADGLLTGLGSKTFPVIQKNVNDIITVSESNIIKAMRLIWERMKIIVEPSAAVGLGVLLENPDLFKKKKVGIILSGGNVDLDSLPF
ncbi:MAG: pyridoxal-phosphate dependent enzyme [Candidatus Neomarinimicrobiota bacterium]